MGIDYVHDTWRCMQIQEVTLTAQMKDKDYSGKMVTAVTY
jgi:hypothetical protein